jgi:hypothetical protein
MPHLLPTLTPWDIALLLAVSLMGTSLAYLHNPKWKSFVLALPIPFTMACLSLGLPIDATNVIGLILLLLYTHGVRFLHVRAHIPIVIAIVLSVAGYVIAGTLIVPALPRTDRAFWIAAAAVFCSLLALHFSTAPRREPGHRTSLPVWVKLPIIVAVVLGLIAGKKMLQGFITVFPMVGIVAAYEARHSLWTICRAIPILALCMLPMMITIRLVDRFAPLGAALAAGWVVYLALMIPAMRAEWRRPHGAAPDGT